MICAIIGSTKIAEVHVNEFVKNSVKHIYIISRNKKKRDDLKIKFCKRYKNLNTNFYSSDKNILKKINFDLIVICSKNNVHHKNFEFLKEFKNIIIVEKPIISLLVFKNNYKKHLDKIYENKKKIIVCYPMQYFASSFKKHFKEFTRPKKLEFIMKTKGRYNNKDIIVNLMPHALTFINEFYNLKNNIHSFEKKDISNNSYNFNFKIKNSLIYVHLSENRERKKTKILFKLDNNIFDRVTKNGIVNFQSYLKIKKKLNIVPNPMTLFYKDFFKNYKNTSFFVRNKKFTYRIMRENFRILNMI